MKYLKHKSPHSYTGQYNFLHLSFKDLIMTLLLEF